MAALTRSLVGVVFPVAILLLFIVATGQWRRWREIPLISSTLIFLAIALPWHIVAELRVPHQPAGFRWFYFVNEQVFRALGVAAAAILAAMLWVSRGLESTNDIAGLLQRQDPSLYRLSMANFLELTPESFAALRVQAALAAILLLLGLVGAWWWRRKSRPLASNLTVALTMAGFLFCANSAFAVFTPHLSSEPVARQIERYLRPGDKIAVYGELEAVSSVGFYTHRQIWIHNGRYNGLAFGSDYPDAPNIFLNDSTFLPFWCSTTRVFLVVPPNQRDNALMRLPPESTYFLAPVGDQQLHTNHRVRPDQPTLAQRLAEGKETVRPARPVLGESCGPPPAPTG